MSGVKPPWEVMNKYLSKNQKKVMEDAMNDLTKAAKAVKKDYEDNPSDMSGSVTQVHENSPYVATKEERLFDYNWNPIVPKDKKDSK
tara:strand:+ start:416 stop:676 length:261 start_codon:yes stop_codon:yes gene_type:complete